jgi:sortase A
MIDRRNLDELSVSELEQLLYRKKRAHRWQRLRRLKDAGRVVDVAGLPPPKPTPPPLIRPSASATGALRHYFLTTENDHKAMATDEWAEEQTRPGISWRWISNAFLLFVEAAAVVGLVILLMNFWLTSRELNQELAQVQQAEVASIALPTPTATPVIRPVVLPGGHRPPVDGRPVDYSEAGNIPQHLLPFINAYVPPPMPTPGPEQARRIQIAAINIDAPIFQGDDLETLKKGVGQHIGSSVPGQNGNLVLSAHNDIFGEIFRHLDKLKPGDEIVVSTERQSYLYVVRALRTVEPTDVWVMDPTKHASVTLISCYPYMVNTKRIIVFADLAGSPATSGRIP